MTFDADTHVERTADHTYTATLTDRWNALGAVPNGGYLLAIALRALKAELPHPDPVVASATYLRPGHTGPATIATEVARTGRRVATGEARLSQDGKEIIRVVATFSDLSHTNGRTVVRSRPPELPPPDETPTVDVDLPGVTIVDRFEYRTPAGRTGEPDLKFWMRLREGREPDPIALAAMVDAAAPAVLELGEPGSATIELTVHVRARPAPGWVACRAVTNHVIGGYHEEDFEIWDSSGALVAQSRQFAVLTG